MSQCSNTSLVPNPTRLTIHGLVTSIKYEVAKSYAETVYLQYPGKISELIYYPYFDVKWAIAVHRWIRKYKHTKFASTVVCFYGNTIICSEEELLKYFKTIGCPLSRFNPHMADEQFSWMSNLTKPGFLSPIRDYFGMKITINGVFVGYLLIELFTEESPTACKKFIQMFRDTERQRKVAIGRLVKGYWFEFGFLSGHITEVEPFTRSHNERGLLSYSDENKRVDAFLITLQPLTYLDKKVCVIGRVLHGETVLRKIESVPTYYQKPLQKIFIETGGVLAVGRNLEEIHFEKFKDDFNVVFNLTEKKESFSAEEGIKCKLPGLGSRESDPDRRLRQAMFVKEFNMLELKDESKENDIEIESADSIDDTVEEIYSSELVLASPISPSSRQEILKELLEEDVFHTDRSDSSLYNFVMQNYFMSQYPKQAWAKKKDPLLKSLSYTSLQVKCDEDKVKIKKDFESKENVLRVLKEAGKESLLKPTFSAQLLEVAQKLKTGLLIGSGSFVDPKPDYSNRSLDSVWSLLRRLSDEKKTKNDEPSKSGLNVTVIKF